MLSIEPDWNMTNKNFISEQSHIQNPEVLDVVYEIFYKLDKDNQYKIVQDLIMLFGFDFHNAETTFKSSNFLDWLVTLIFRSEDSLIVDADQTVNVLGLKELVQKLSVVFLYQIIFHTSLDKAVLSRFLATFEKKLSTIGK